MEYLIGFFVGFAVVLFLACVTLFARTGSFRTASWGLNVAARGNLDPNFSAQVKALLATPLSTSPYVPGETPAAVANTTTPVIVETKATKPEKPVREKPSGAPLRVLALLQAEARLVDFLLEDISTFDDQQVGQAVRDIHRKAQTVLRQHIVMEPILHGAEGESVVVAAGFDPSAIRVLGNVSGQPPYTGNLQHPGWRVSELKLTPLTAGQDEFVVQPAEVQID